MSKKLQFQLESYTQVKREIQPLIEEHYNAIALHRDVIKLNPDWKQYAKYDSMNALRVYTARSDGELVGYFVVVISKSLHYQDHLFATNDIIYLSPKHRKGTAGIRLIKFAEEQVKAEGITLLVINTKAHAPFDAILERNGFELTERVYSKLLKDK